MLVYQRGFRFLLDEARGHQTPPLFFWCQVIESIFLLECVAEMAIEVQMHLDMANRSS
jgi:hypothetical protein